MSGDRAVVMLLYRCMLRWNRTLSSVPLELRPSHVDEVLPGFRKQHHGDVSSIRDLAQWGFRQHDSGSAAVLGQHLSQGEHKGLLIDKGFRALQLLNTEYAQALRYLQAARSEHLDPGAVLFSVGTVFRHKKHGYKGVIYAWDKQCDRPEAWAKEVQVKHKQPFYSVLPDEHDCVRLFQGGRTSKYVAQENVEVLQDQRVVHRAVMSYFTEYSSGLGRYIPNARMQYEYPGTYQASDAKSCASDSNLLLHDDPDHYADPYADPYEDNPDSQHGQCPAEEAEVQSQQNAASESESKAGSSHDTEQATSAKAEVPIEGTNGSGDRVPEQSVGTDVKR
ncbi:TPA: hypothetical protein ACH3X1_014642 [Trebouxia sp. C0004]